MKHSKLIAAKRIAVAVAAVCATMSAPAFAADDVKNLLDLMLKKGVITQAEYDDYRTRMQHRLCRCCNQDQSA